MEVRDGTLVVNRPKGPTERRLIVQHADLASQKKYLPMIKQAAAQGEAQAANVAP